MFLLQSWKRNETRRKNVLHWKWISKRNLGESPFPFMQNPMKFLFWDGRWAPLLVKQVCKWAHIRCRSVAGVSIRNQGDEKPFSRYSPRFKILLFGVYLRKLELGGSSNSESGEKDRENSTERSVHFPTKTATNKGWRKFIVLTSMNAMEWQTKIVSTVHCSGF